MVGRRRPEIHEPPAGLEPLGVLTFVETRMLGWCAGRGCRLYPASSYLSLP